MGADLCDLIEGAMDPDAHCTHVHRIFRGYMLSIVAQFSSLHLAAHLDLNNLLCIRF
jgi:hypothetical protein